MKNSNNDIQLQKLQDFSSNNGSCIASCTDIYSLYDADDNCIVESDSLLGLRYLNLIDEIEKLISIGVYSFKIEGRQRDIAYVKNITALCNEKINNLLKTNKHSLKRLSSGTSVVDFTPGLDKIYSRGFTNYFFNGRKKENLSRYSPFGKYIGQVSYQEKEFFKIKNSNLKLNPGDKILCSKEGMPNIFIDISKVDNEDYYFNYKENDIVGYNLYRVVDAKSVEEIEKAHVCRYISLKVIFKRMKTKYLVTMIDEDGIKSATKCDIDAECEISLKKVIEMFNFKECLRFNIEADGNVVCLNELLISRLRDKLIEELIKKRENARPRKSGQIKKESRIKYPEDTTCLDNINNSRAIEFYKQHGVKSPVFGVEYTKDISNKKIYAGRYCIKYELGYCKNEKCDNMPNLPWYIKDKYDNKYKLEFNCNNCEMYIKY